MIIYWEVLSGNLHVGLGGEINVVFSFLTLACSCQGRLSGKGFGMVTESRVDTCLKPGQICHVFGDLK